MSRADLLPLNWHTHLARGGKLVVGNWKMNGTRAMLPLVAEIAAEARHVPDVRVGVAVPHTLIAAAHAAASDLPIGAQDIHAEVAGAYTGSVSADMVQDAGACFTILNHSERRYGPDAVASVVAAKIARATERALTVILCCGETAEERQAGMAEQAVGSRLKAVLQAVPAAARLVLAYEPYWAIGSGLRPSMGQIAAMHVALAAETLETVGSKTLPILYGGSVDPASARDIAGLPQTAGVLVGSLSLSPASFGLILNAVHNSRGER